jgi:hypothetical protein
VSADSVQRCRGVQIGANKPTLQERSTAKTMPHDMVDMVDVFKASNHISAGSHLFQSLASHFLMTRILANALLMSVKILAEDACQSPSYFIFLDSSCDGECDSPNERTAALMCVIS